jgi:hypothetical protein
MFELIPHAMTLKKVRQNSTNKMRPSAAPGRNLAKPSSTDLVAIVVKRP